MKKRIYEIINVSKNAGDASWWFDTFLITIILLNVVALLAESVEPLRIKYQSTFDDFEIFSVVLFTAEYFLRFWAANEEDKFRKPVIGNLRYALTPLAIMDLMAILPFYLPLFGLDLRTLRILRLFRLVRLLKIVRYISAMSHINQVIKEKKEELSISIFFTLFMLIITSTIMYYVEHEQQPDKFSSIPETMWWGIATLTTVGYGDIYPVTGLGKFLGGIIAIIGIGMFALPTGILASGFSQQISRETKTQSTCPHCGKDINQN